MPEYRRIKIAGGTYFFTVVTYKRKPILTNINCRLLLHVAWKDVMVRFPFHTDAICLLPDHIHCIWTLPEGDNNYSLRWSEIKKKFSKAYHLKFGTQDERKPSQVKRKEAGMWQRRFWEHIIRDSDDFNSHVEYIHYNPVKHGLVDRVKDWEWSSFHRFVKDGFIDENWGASYSGPLGENRFGE